MKSRNKIFKKCSGCGFIWDDRSLFLSDPDVSVAGYQVHFENLELGLFLFNHTCGTTISLKAESFSDLYKGPVFKERKQGTSQCPGFCLHKDEIRPCPVKCECTYVREVLRLVNTWGKSGK